MLPTTFYGNQKQPLIFGTAQSILPSEENFIDNLISDMEHLEVLSCQNRRNRCQHHKWNDTPRKPQHIQHVNGKSPFLNRRCIFKWLLFPCHLSFLGCIFLGIGTSSFLGKNLNSRQNKIPKLTFPKNQLGPSETGFWDLQTTFEIQ